MKLLAEIIVRLPHAAAFGNVDPLFAQELATCLRRNSSWATMMTFSTGMLRLILVQLGDEVVILLGRRQMTGRHELIAEHELLVFAIERYDLHNEIGAMLQALADLGHRLFCASVRPSSNPCGAQSPPAQW